METGPNYAFGMTNWGPRFRAHMKLHKQSQESLGAVLGVTQGAVRHWISGRRPIQMVDFWRLCEAAGADPQYILFGNHNPKLVSEIRQVFASHPELVPGYRKFEKSISRKKPRKRRAKTHS